MKNRRLIFTTILITMTQLSSLSVQATESGDIHRRAQTIKLPSASSQALQASIKKEYIRSYEEEVGNTPQTKREWLTFIQEINSGQKKKIKNMRKQLPVDVEKMDLNGVVVRKITPRNPDPAFKNKIYIDIHGGAYVLFAGINSIEEGLLVASRAGITVYSVDYRMPPQHPFPAALEDTLNVYKALLENHLAENIAIGGTSAGGGLTLATLLKIKEQKLEMPAAAYTGTPWADLTKTGDTLFTNEIIDRILVTYDGTLGAAARLYAGEVPLKNPFLSPVYGDLSGLPPVMLVSGTRDMFLSDTVRMNRKLRNAGVDTLLDVYEGFSHADYLVAYETPESLSMYDELKGFLLKHF